MPNPANHTSGNQQHYDSRSQGDGGPVHDVQIGLAPTRLAPRHLDSQLNGKMAGVISFVPFSTGVTVITAGSPRLQNVTGRRPVK